MQFDFARLIASNHDDVLHVEQVLLLQLHQLSTQFKRELLLRERNHNQIAHDTSPFNEQRERFITVELSRLRRDLKVPHRPRVGGKVPEGYILRSLIHLHPVFPPPEAAERRGGGVL
jgi:hypothetical protein